MVIEELVKTVLSELREISKTETVIGKPFKVGDTTIVPLSRITLGFAVGGGSKKEKNDRGEVTGGGATIEPVAFFVIDESKVELVTVKKEEIGLKKIIDLVPQIVEKVKDLKTQKSKNPQGNKKGKK